MKHTMKRVTREFDVSNRQCAEIILSDARYQGIMRTWALDYLLRLEREAIAEAYPLLARAVKAA